jgi:type I restriction enzyme S subunit
MGKAIITSHPSFTNQQLHTIIPSAEVDALFLYYSFSPRQKEFLSIGSAAGVRTPIINKSAFCDLTVQLPCLCLQRKIAGILSAYDDLIENNTRRIALLEEMAQAIYREWFVHYRFPGHEDVKHVKSPLGKIPEGWSTLPFSQSASFVNGFAFKPEHWGDDGKPIIKIAELKNGVTTKTPRHPGDGIPEKYTVKSGDLLFSWSADLEAYIWPHEEGLLNQHLFTVLPNAEFTKEFLYFALRHRMPEFRSLSLGTTMRHIKRSALDHVSLVCPPPHLRADFTELIKPFIQQSIVATKKVGVLRQTRDLLLPKLISGQLDVEALDIEIREPLVEAVA